MPGQTNDYGQVLNRRRFVELAGTTGVAALAGCGSDGEATDPESGGQATATSGETTETTSGGESQQLFDVAHYNMANQVPTDIHFNPSNPSNYSEFGFELLFDPMAKFNLRTGEFVPYGISEWSHGDQTFEMKIREGLTWENGDPVTSEDVATQLRIAEYLGDPMWSFTESIDTPDERTVKLNLSEKTNPTIVEHNALSKNIIQKASKYKEYLKALEENEEQGLSKLQQFSDQDPIASGPFTYDNASQQQLVMNRRDDHPDSGNINFSQYILKYLGGNQQAWQAIMSMGVDSLYSIFTPPKIVKQMPDQVMESRTPSSWGYGLVPNHDDPHLGNRKVRQAIMHVLNREEIVGNAGPRTKQPMPVPTAITVGSQEKWLGDEASSYESYGVAESQTDKATKLMEEAGYSKENGTWRNSDGAVNLPIVVPSGWSDWVVATETAVNQLSSFGFNSSVDGRSFGTVSGQVWTNGNFKLTTAGWSGNGARQFFPYFPLRHQLVKPANSIAYNYDTGEKTVPKRTGSGEMTTNPKQRISELSKSTEDQNMKSIVREQAWVANQDLPMLPIMEKQEQTWLTTDDWEMPSEDKDVFGIQYAPSWLPRQGKMQYIGGN